jgi:hypothetical protein
VIAEVSGTPNPAATVQLSVSYGGATHLIDVGETQASAEALASAIGQAINSTLVGAFSCPVVVPVEQFSNYLDGQVTNVNYSIGPDIEILAYEWGGLSPPTIAVSSGSVGAVLSLPNVNSTFMPADALYVGTTGTSSGPVAPSDVSVVGTTAFGATNGAGLHLQGGSSVLFSADVFGSATAPNLYGVQLDESSGFLYADAQVQDSILSGTSANVYLNPSTSTLVGVLFTNNIGYNPVGDNVGPPQSCGAVTTNPFVTNQQLYVSGSFTQIKKNGIKIFDAGSTAVVILGIAETIEIDCAVTLPHIYWYGT